MLDMKQVGKCIKNARTKKNMTQLELADRVGVSYQAVSNWERGCSMPDVAKIPDIARELGLSISELLEEEKHPSAVAAVNKTLNEPEAVLSPTELAEIAPILPPNELKEKVEKTPGNAKYDLSALVELAPYLDDDYLNELIRNADLSDMSGILELAPYLSEEALTFVSRRLEPDGTDELTELAGYFTEEALDSLTDRLLREGKTAALTEIVDYLSTESVRKIADHLLKNKDIDGLSKIKDYL